MESLSQQMETRLSDIEKTYGLFSKLAKHRYTNEELLQLELALLASKMNNVEFVLPERPYPNELCDNTSRNKVDIWFKTNERKEHWMELKMRSTNYRRRGPSGRAITHGVESIIEDYKRLKCLPEGNMKHLFFFFIPIYDDSYRFFGKHLEKISLATRSSTTDPDIVIRLKDSTDGRMEGFVVSFE